MNRLIEIVGLIALIAIWAAVVAYILLRRNRNKRKNKHEDGSSTLKRISYCPRCGSVLYRKNIVRRGYIVKLRLCSVCGYAEEI